MNSSVIVVMAKRPQVGWTKTRLCPPLSLEEAAVFSEALLLDTLVLVGSSLERVDLAVAITPANARPYFERIVPNGTRLLPVSGATIGECLAQAFRQLFALGYQRVIAFNADGPSLPPDYLQQAGRLLVKHPLVLGPGLDGGYYLIGMRTLHQALFEGIDWSTTEVLSQTMARAAEQGLDTALAPPWYDVDTGADLRRLISELTHLPADRLVNVRRFITKAGLGNRLGSG
jgi:rSAM/selenodomain-associated transferase 1